MRTIQFISLISIFLMLCSCETDPAKRNVKKFVEDAIEESLALDKSNVASIEITETDSLLSPVLATIELNAAMNAEAEYLQGTISRDSLMSFAAEHFGYYQTLAQVWQIDPKPVKKAHKYESSWRKAYRAKVTFKDGSTRDPRVIMDSDGVTPVELEGKVLNLIDQLRRQLEKLSYL